MPYDFVGGSLDGTKNDPATISDEAIEASRGCVVQVPQNSEVYEFYRLEDDGKLHFLKRVMSVLDQASRIREIEGILPIALHGLLDGRDGAARLAEQLPKEFTLELTSTPCSIAQQAWAAVGVFYVNLRRYHEALMIFEALYNHMILYQQVKKKWCHKGMPLIFMADCYRSINCPTVSRRHEMLALVEDAIRDKGVLTVIEGTYFRMVWSGGLSPTEHERYGRLAYDSYKALGKDALFPERILQELDQNWINRLPSPDEVGIFAINRTYVRYLMSRLGEPSGRRLEFLADYLLSCMPGCRTTRRSISRVSEYDVVCSMDGFDVDFRSELGRYFVCECKDIKDRVSVPMLAKFCRILDSTKARFGIIFTRQGISGEGRARFAELEQIKIFQDRGMVIVVINDRDIESVANGENFINILRDKYKDVRLDLIKSKAPPKKVALKKAAPKKSTSKKS